MIAQFFYDGPIGLLYYSGPPWTFIAIVVFLGLLLFVITRTNGLRSGKSGRQKKPQ